MNTNWHINGSSQSVTAGQTILEWQLTWDHELVLFGGPILIERLFNVNLFDILVLFCPQEMTTLDLNLYTHMGCQRNIPIYAQASVSVHSQETEDIQALDWCPGVFCFFLFFFVLSARGKAAAKPLPPAPCPLQSRGAECTHQPVWKPTFSRILPEGVTQRNPLWAPAACWMLCRGCDGHVLGYSSQMPFQACWWLKLWSTAEGDWYPGAVVFPL